MGYNRSGKRRAEKQKRYKRELTRLIAKLEAGNKETPAKATSAKS